jgi:hypothetical protein
MGGFNFLFNSFVQFVNRINNGFDSPIQTYEPLYNSVKTVIKGIYLKTDEYTQLKIEVKVEDNERLVLRVPNDYGFNSVTIFRDGDIILMLEMPDDNVLDGVHIAYEDLKGDFVAEYLLEMY